MQPTPGRLIERARVVVVALTICWVNGYAWSAPIADADHAEIGVNETANHRAPASSIRGAGHIDSAAMERRAEFGGIAQRGQTPSTEPAQTEASGSVRTAMTYLGMPYRRGGASAEQGFDCSGFTRRVFQSIGLFLPRSADEQAAARELVAIRRDELQPGDLVFFNTLRRTFSHVGIYVGDGRFIHAPRVGGRVRVESIGARYWATRFTGARRTVPDGT